MSDRPKAKLAPGVRNSDRKNGKAWKKNPKSPRRHKNPEGRRWEDKEEARRVRRLPLREKFLEKQARHATQIQEQLAKQESDRKRRVRQSNSKKKLSVASEKNHEMIEAMKAGKLPS